ncbi:MAG: hypothetical protein HUU48_09195 [Flavobacteriales bacterium]|nr:hypothetical protein [Flavobacteriales bacterium]
MITKKCAYNKCGRTFYTNNPKANVCCDNHRSKLFRELNKEKIEYMAKWKRVFANNARILKRLYNNKFTNVNTSELTIADFDLSVRDAQKESEDGRDCFQYFDYLLIKSKDNNGFEIRKATAK